MTEIEKLIARLDVADEAAKLIAEGRELSKDSSLPASVLAVFNVMLDALAGAAAKMGEAATALRAMQAERERLRGERDVLEANKNAAHHWRRENLARAEAAEAKVRELALDVLAADGQAQEAYQAQLAAEAKLAEVEKERDEAFESVTNNNDWFSLSMNVWSWLLSQPDMPELPELEEGAADAAERNFQTAINALCKARAEATVATLTAQVEAMRGALDEIANQGATHAADRCTCTPTEMLNEARAIARAALTTENQTND